MDHIRQKSCTDKQSVYDLNNLVIGVIKDAANSALPIKKITRKKAAGKNKNVWFDADCRKSKRLTNKLAKKFFKLPNNENKSFYFSQRKLHRSLIKRKKKTLLYWTK